MPKILKNHFVLIDSLKTTILLINQHKQIIFVNAAGEEFLQISNSRIHGKPIIDIFENADLLQSCLERLNNHSNSIIIKEIAIKAAVQKRKIVTCAFNPVTQSNLANDIFASIEIISENRFSILDINTENKTTTTDNNQSLLQGMAHEIKNPLGGIRGAAQLLSNNLSQREDKDYINIILAETDRLNQLVDRMSGHIKDKRMLPINIHRILEHIYKLLKADDKNISIKRDYDPSLPEIIGSETSLTQAFLNLALNALQAVTENAQIIFRSRLVYGTVIKDQQHRQALRIDIQDNGNGIDESIRNKIFEPLISSKSQGTGLGLSITKEIISMHNGKVEFSSEPGKTMFSVFFPILEKK